MVTLWTYYLANTIEITKLSFIDFSVITVYNVRIVYFDIPLPRIRGIFFIIKVIIYT